MNDCISTSALLHVYVDDEASAETNALVSDHLRTCAACWREFEAIVALRDRVRGTLRQGKAPDALRDRIASSLREHKRRGLMRALAGWLVPASAVLAAIMAWVAWGTPGSAVEAAVHEHVACALNNGASRVPPEVAAARGDAAAMPWIRDAAHELQAIEAHTCGDGPTFSHVVLRSEGGTVSVLIARREHAPARGPQDARFETVGEFDVAVTTSSRYTVYLVGPRAPDEAVRAWRQPVLERIEQFLRQLEDAS